MKEFKELFEDWCKEECIIPAEFSLYEKAAFYIYEKMKDQYGNVEGESFKMYVNAIVEDSIKGFRSDNWVSLSCEERDDFDKEVIITFPKQKSKEEKVKDLFGIDLTESQWKILEEIFKSKEL